MNRISISLLSAFFSLSIASAGILESKTGEKALEGVKLAKEVVFQSEGKPVPLKPYVSGIRKKKIALFWAKVYIGQIFTPAGLASPPSSLEEIQKDLASQPLVAITMTFLRDVETGRIINGFEDALEMNGINPKSEAMKPLFSILEKGGDVKDTLTTSIVFERRKDGSEWVYFENGKKELQTTTFEKGMIAKTLLIWVGKPADSGMERLHQQFLGKDD